ncbi:hypothetical protein ACHAQJ_005994 [Trichoderma viride]
MIKIGHKPHQAGCPDLTDGKMPAERFHGISRRRNSCKNSCLALPRRCTAGRRIPVPLCGIIKDVTRLYKSEHSRRKGIGLAAVPKKPLRILLGDLSTVAGVRTRAKTSSGQGRCGLDTQWGILVAR